MQCADHVLDLGLAAQLVEQEPLLAGELKQALLLLERVPQVADAEQAQALAAQGDGLEGELGRVGAAPRLEPGAARDLRVVGTLPHGLGVGPEAVEQQQHLAQVVEDVAGAPGSCPHRGDPRRGRGERQVAVGEHLEHGRRGPRQVDPQRPVRAFERRPLEAQAVRLGLATLLSLELAGFEEQPHAVVGREDLDARGVVVPADRVEAVARREGGQPDQERQALADVVAAGQVCQPIDRELAPGLEQAAFGGEVQVGERAVARAGLTQVSGDRGGQRHRSPPAAASPDR